MPNIESIEKLPTLVDPSGAYKDSFLAGMRALQTEGRNKDKDLGEIETHFDAFISKLEKRAKGVDLEEGKVAQTTKWLVLDGQYAGALRVRHYLTQEPPPKTGHIGYEVVPQFRERGYATFMLQEGLRIAKTLGLDHVMLSTAENNTASQHVIEKCGGTLEETFEIPGEGKKRRYRINLS